MRRPIVVAVYLLKLRVMLWRAARCFRPCDRLSSPSLLMLLQLRIKRNKTTDRYCYCYSLPAEAKSDSVESYKMFQAL